ncbi:MAG TPA: hypothetical protein VNM90_29605 [Haliangium sp.]|nr:hypothetical protein [Haliangium sp.]
MKKLLVILVLAAVAGALVYRFVLVTPEARLCSRMVELCGEQGTSSCERDYGELRKAMGPEAMERAADCVEDSATCTEAVACMATGFLRDFTEQVGKGIERSLEQK